MRSLFTRIIVIRTTLDLPKSSSGEATSPTSIKTKTEVIKTALENLVKKARLKTISDYFGREL
jgi:purine nucleoside permease